MRSDEATEHGTKAHDVKIRAADNATSNGTRLTEADHGEVHGGEVAKRAQGFYACAQILYLWYGEGSVVVADAWGALPDIDQPVLVAVDKRLEQDSAHQRENGSVCADAERQREHHGDRQALASALTSALQLSDREGMTCSYPPRRGSALHLPILSGTFKRRNTR